MENAGLNHEGNDLMNARKEEMANDNELKNQSQQRSTRSNNNLRNTHIDDFIIHSARICMFDIDRQDA